MTAQQPLTVIPFREHEAFRSEREMIDTAVVGKWYIHLNATHPEPQRFFLTGFKPGFVAGQQVSKATPLATKGTFPTLKQAREHLEEFAKALMGSTAVLIGLYVAIPGSGL